MVRLTGMYDDPVRDIVNIVCLFVFCCLFFLVCLWILFGFLFVCLFYFGCLFLFFLFCFLEATPPAAEDEGQEEEVTHTQEKEDKEKGEMEDDTQEDKQVCEIPLIK